MSPLAISLRFLQTQPDERLVALARDGHERAFEALVRRYRSQLLAYCRRVAPRGTPPEDILQQGLLQAWRALSSGAEVRDARAWLYRIVHNVAISTLRASGELPDGLPTGAGAPGVEQVVEQRMAARDALAGLAALPDLQRQVMVSTALDGRSHEEIAAALGLSSGSVRGLIYRARTTLRAAAAAVIPAPLIDWAAGEAGSASAGLAGAGSAGLGALILKGGGAILAVGAVAGTTAIVVSHHPHHARQLQGAPVAATSRRATDAGPTSSTAGDAGRNALAFIGGSTQGSRVDARAGSHDGHSGGGSGHDGSGDGGGSQGTASRGGDGSGGGSGGGDHGGTTTTSGSDGGGHGGTTTTSGSGGGDHGGTTTTSGSDGGGTSGATTATSGSDGGGTSGSSDGGTSGSSDGGTSGSSDGGSSGTTTTTTTTTTTSH
jgi:RNA polymerase sigma factor (sigma-70 family)